MLISTIIPTYNRSDFIKSTLQSVIDQTYPHWEAIVVDDGSIDDTYDVVKKMVAKDSRIKLIRRNREPKGAPTCRNIGLENAKGNFVMFLDSDDLLAPYCLEQRSYYCSKFDERDFWVFPMLLFKNKVNDTLLYTNLPNSENDLYRFLRSDLPWSISCVLWKKTFLKILGSFDESFPNCQDHDLHLRALWQTKNYQTFPKAVPDNFYRQHTGDKIYNPNDKRRFLVGARMLFRRHTDIVYQREDSAQRTEYYDNLLIFFKYLLKEHLFIEDFQNALALKDFLAERKILSPLVAAIFSLYIQLVKFGFNRIKGFYRLWDLILFRYRRRSSWGNIPFKGKLQLNSPDQQVVTN